MEWSNEISQQFLQYLDQAPISTISLLNTIELSHLRTYKDTNYKQVFKHRWIHWMSKLPFMIVPHYRFLSDKVPMGAFSKYCENIRKI